MKEARDSRDGDTKVRCQWCIAGNDPKMIAYHDEEWGAPVHDDRALFEAFVLGGAQAGLSWATVLKKRDNYRRAFARFEPAKVARYTERHIAQMMQNQGLIRNNLKLRSAVSNAKAILKVQDEFGSFDAYAWQFVDGKPKLNAWKSMSQLPARTQESDAMSKDMKKRGFSFIGSTICYAVMQSVGMVNDHTVDCFRYRELKAK